MSNEFEQQVRTKLGFYPSYLAAIEEYEACAEFVWDETQQILTEPWAQLEGETVARQAQSVIDEEIPPAIDTDLDAANTAGRLVENAVELFSFVMFRLGLSISACRYGVEEKHVQQTHSQTATTTSVTSAEIRPLIKQGIEKSLPIDPEITLIDPADASDDVGKTYARICRELETPNVNNVFRAFAVEPQFLETVVETQIRIIQQADMQQRLESRLRGLYAAALEEHSLALSRHRLRQVAETDNAVDSVVESLRTYHENLPTLVLTLYLGALFMSR